ncbi:hypothetical protein DND58_14285 [Pseudomonas syringae pv. pisi]|nr:hypothetical protein DND62_12070 [Pseudomonas syringae pv. pisi]PYD30983.1 hypothetical protein DND58_14285 [Pseudomonas syringae pv. pisi]PYD34507.1 hypothetical protein DND67_08100 [Pseudomonas syringae pv. pisi]
MNSAEIGFFNNRQNLVLIFSGEEGADYPVSQNLIIKKPKSPKVHIGFLCSSPRAGVEFRGPWFRPGRATSPINLAKPIQCILVYAQLTKHLDQLQASGPIGGDDLPKVA